jgi:hypothetical protein
LAVKDNKRLKKYQQVENNHGPTPPSIAWMVSRAMIYWETNDLNCKGCIHYFSLLFGMNLTEPSGS